MSPSSTGVGNPHSKRIVYIAYTMGLIGVCGHASSEFFTKLTDLTGPETTVWRFMIGGACLVAISLIWPSSRDLVTPLRRDGLPIAALSILGMSMGQLFFHWALDYATVIQVATIVTTMPIGVVVVDRIINGARITTPKIVSGLGAFAGVVFLLSDGYLGTVAETSSLPGILMATACSLIGAIYLVLAKPYFIQYGAIRMTTYTFALGFFAIYPLVGVFWGIWVDPFGLFDRSLVSAAAIITLGVWNTTIGFIFWLGGLALAPDTARANYLFFLKPVIAAVLAVWILNEPISGPQFTAIALVTGCVAVEVFWDELVRLAKKLRGKQA